STGPATVAAGTALKYPIRGTLFGCCASADEQSAKSVAHRTKLPSFRLFISPHASWLSPHCCACFVPKPGHIHLPLSDRKQAGLEIVGLSVNVLFWSAPEIETTFVTEPPSLLDCVSDIFVHLPRGGDRCIGRPTFPPAARPRVSDHCWEV